MTEEDGERQLARMKATAQLLEELQDSKFEIPPTLLRLRTIAFDGLSN